jgi:hypothetical protein
LVNEDDRQIHNMVRSPRLTHDAKKDEKCIIFNINESKIEVKEKEKYQCRRISQTRGSPCIRAQTPARPGLHPSTPLGMKTRHGQGPKPGYGVSLPIPTDSAWVWTASGSRPDR